jgi:hypothetical protein
VTAVSLARALERRFGGRPHVGVVTHFEGLDAAATAARLEAAARAAGLALEGAMEAVAGRRVFNATAAVPARDGLELWLSAREQPAVGCTVEARVYHALEQSALADEYLAAFSRRLVASGPADPVPRKDDA